MAKDGKPENQPDATAPAAPLPPIAGKAKDLESLRNAVVDAANVSGGLWFSYLFVLLYLVVAVGSVTHRNLFFETAVKLPFLGVDLPLVGFFTLGPLIFLVIHAYVLVHFVLLADKVGAFHAELLTQIADDDVRTQLRRQLPSNIFVQFLAGPREVRTGLMGMMLRLIAVISLVIGPLALLVFFELQFLPYHDEAILWWQRIMVVLDLALLWALWPSVGRGETSAIAWRDFRRWKVTGAALLSAMPVVLVFAVATYPEEWLDRNPVSVPLIPQFRTPSSLAPESVRWVSLHEFLVAGDIDLVARKPNSIWSNRLVLLNFEPPPQTPLSLRGRRLEGAVLISASLKGMDFTAVRLQGAVLDHADLREAKFVCAESKLKIGVDVDPERRELDAEQNCAQLRHASLIGAQLQGAQLTDAKLPGAVLSGAQIQNAVLDRADLEGATLDSANLQGASLRRARLPGASLGQAKLQGAGLQSAILHGARLDNAELQGANLEGAELYGANLNFAQLQGATLSHAHLEGANMMLAKVQGGMLPSAVFAGASLDGAVLQAASLSRARFDGASLDSAVLHGALLDGADFNGASLRWVGVWRTEMPTLDRPIRLNDPETGSKMPSATQACGNQYCEWTAEEFYKTRKLIELVPGKFSRDRALQAFAKLDPASAFEGEVEFARAWTKRASTPLSTTTTQAYEASLAAVLLKIGCDKKGAPYVIRAMTPLIAGRFEDKSAQPSALATAFLDKARCPGAAGLPDETKKTLRALQQRAATTQ